MAHAPAKPAALSLSDALGLGRLAADGAVGITGLVEDMHKRILGTPGLAPIAQVVTGGVTRLVYQRRARRISADRQGVRQRRGARRRHA